MSSSRISHISTRVSDYVATSEAIGEIGPSLFSKLVPNFAKKIKFALVEVLELDREVSRAKTWAYYENNRSDFDQIVEQYFSLVDGLFSKRSFSISSADEFYFGDQIFFSRVENSTAPRVESTPDALGWTEPHQTDLRRDYHARNSVPLVDLSAAYNHYVEKLSVTLLKGYPVAYILLVPVALNHHESQRQRKVGAAFLHFGLNEPLENLDDEKQFARDVFQGINLFWHYNLTAEALYKQLLLAESATQAKSVADMHKQRIDTYSTKILPLLERLDAIRAEIRRHIDPSALGTARDALTSLSRLMTCCFPSTGELHDPFGHKDLTALCNIGEQIVPWAELFSTALVDAKAFDQVSANLLLEPFATVLIRRSNTAETNDPKSPHPALCLAKCISNSRIPLAWILIALKVPGAGSQPIHWQRYLSLTAPVGNPSILDDLYPLKVISEKLELSTPQINDEGNTVTITLTPKWETSIGYEAFCTRMLREMPDGMLPTGGTVTQLSRLVERNYVVILEVVDGEQSYERTFARGSVGQDTSTSIPPKIVVSKARVAFVLPTSRERIRGTPSI